MASVFGGYAVRSEIWGSVEFALLDVPCASGPEGVVIREHALRARAFNLFSGSSWKTVECGRPPVSSSVRLSHLTCAADVCLHNRADLIRRLGLDISERDADDTALVLSSYDKWGLDCTRYLLGEFAFAIWDDRLQRLFCCRDQMGFRPFYYYASAERFAFGSNPRFILSLPYVPRQLNQLLFASLALAGARFAHHSDTFHTGVQSLPSGSSLTVGRNGVLHISGYWHPEIQSGLVPKRPAEVYEALREIMFEAVDCRIQGDAPATVELSGGLDSSGIAAIAARCLERKGRSLLAVAAVLPTERTGSLSDERSYIDEFRNFPNVQIEYVTAIGRGPFDTIGDLDQFVSSPILASVFYLHDALKEAAIKHGAQCQLRGLLGELGPTCGANAYYPELAARLRWKTLWKELKKIQALHGHRPARFFGGQVLRLMRPGGSFRNNGSLLVTQEFLHHWAECPAPLYAWPDQRLQQLAEIRRFLSAHATWQSRASEDGIRFSHPWLDKRVIEFCLAAPPELKVQNGYRRYLMRGALEGILPERIRWRITKTPFSPDYSVRYNSQLAKAQAFIGEIGPKDPVREVIDVEAVRRLLVPADPSVAAAQNPLIVVPSNIYAICFLRQFPEFRR